jgi:hypothetical protein
MIKKYLLDFNVEFILNNFNIVIVIKIQNIALLNVHSLNLSGLMELSSKKYEKN